ncbi:MAG: PEP-CTERM sorting domain-containing protein [Calothrix sp. MO_167.B42]|nr:PEP-CTERM sorting domain-containing protein [Calothrix sp. MO_167.B42]
MKNIFTTLISSSILAASVTLLSAQANAGTFRSCTTNDYDIIDNVTGTSDCTISDFDKNDSVSPNKPLTVNEEQFFGKTDWEFGGKIGEDAGYAGTGEGQEGTWDISSVIEDDWEDVMLVFKSGKGTTLVGYEVEDGVTSGDWDSVFEDDAFDELKEDQTKDVSHISVYYTKGTSTPPKQEVPEPANIFGLGVVGGAMVLSRRRRQHQQLSEKL